MTVRLTRTLILMRHGKADNPDDFADHDRPLAPRGQREAALAGEWLRDRLPAVSAISCSTALRTRETLAATGIDAPASFEKHIYEASPHTLIDLIRATSDTFATLLMIGHSPGIPWTAWELAGNRSAPTAEALSTRFPTSALAVLEFAQPWSEISTGVGELVHFHIPR